MRNFRVLSLLCVVMITGMIACKKGDTGPAGAAGAAGTNGTPGATGPAGPDSVITSTWTLVNYTTYQLGATNTDTFYIATMTASAVTQAVIDGGVVNTYVEFADTATNGTGLFQADYWFPTVIVGVGQILLASQDVTLNGILNFRYIVIPAAIVVAQEAKGVTVDQLKHMTYAQVQKIIGSGTAPHSN